MGVSFSCPFAEYGDVENGLESVIVKSINFGDEEVKTPVRSVSFNSRDLEPTILKSMGSGKMVKEGSVSFKESGLGAMLSQASSLSEKEKEEPSRSLQIMLSETDNHSPRSNNSLELMVPPTSPLLDNEKDESIKSVQVKVNKMDNQSLRSDSSADTIRLSVLNPSNPKHVAAIKLQKVYKSFRTRRKLADCAVLVEQSWWKLLDFAELKRSSISFFDIEKHETAISRWSRARTRAAKVGKGLSKNDKAQKLALQHWLEAIDPRHRYGHNLHFYYEKWLSSHSREPFFYWLDIGEGREVNLVERCPRSKLQQQCIKYLGPMERKAYEVVVKDGEFYYKQTGELLNTSIDVDAKWIFVLSTSKVLYVGKKKKGTFQHSSFLAGGATSAAGRLIVESGELKAVWPHSGHYRPTEQNFQDFVSYLKENNVDLTDVQMSPVDEEEGSDGKQSYSMHIRSNSSDEDLTQALEGLESDENNVEDSSHEKTGSSEHETNALLNHPNPGGFHDFSRKLSSLKIPKRIEFFERLESESPTVEPYCDKASAKTPVDVQNFVSGVSAKQDLPEEAQEENEAIPQEAILKRINSRKGMKSYQLGKQLSCKWTTGAGPRIGCVRDYPCLLQFRALEQLSLSPKSAGHPRSRFSPSPTSSSNLLMPSPPSLGMKMEATERGISLLKTIHHVSRTQSTPVEFRTELESAELCPN